MNLRILLSGGKETDKDILSSFEQTGIIPALGLAYRRWELYCSGRYVYPGMSNCFQVHLVWGHLTAVCNRPVAADTHFRKISPYIRIA